MVIGRPKKDAEEKRGTTLTFKVTSAEHLRLSRLAKHRAEELYQATSQRFDVTLASYLRWLIDLDAQKRGVMLEEPKEEANGFEPAPEPAPMIAPPVASRSRAATSKAAAAKKAPKTADLRDEIVPYRKRHAMGQRAFAKEIGMPSQSGISSLEAKKRDFSPEQETAFRTLLEADG